MPQTIGRWIATALLVGLGLSCRGSARGDEPGPLPEDTAVSAAATNDAIDVKEDAVEGRSTADAHESASDSQAEEQPTDAKPAGGKGKPEKPPNPFKGSFFFDADFRYLDEPDNPYHYLGDSLKRRHLGEHFVLDVGGEYRLRQANESTILRRDNFLLQRARVYGNLQFDDWLRVYAEGIDARSSWGRAPCRGGEVNPFDALNLFADVRFLEGDDGSAWLRGGRMQLSYGSQRVIGSRDWSNTLLPWDGSEAFWRGKNWDVDVFWFRPVPNAQHITSPASFDQPDPHQEFYGAYATYKEKKDQVLDLYYLRFGNYAGDLNQNHTFGGRWQGQHDHWLWETEGAYQFGVARSRWQSAGFFTLGGGRKLDGLPWDPVLWLYYDWASGDPDPNDSWTGTYDQLFPAPHKFLGYTDIIGRQNIQDVNIQFTLNPTSKIELMAWYHVFHLQQARDALYNTAGVPVRQDAGGAAGTDVGQELDLTLRWRCRPRADVYLGYGHFFPGHFLSATPGGGPQQDFYYTQFCVKF